MRKNLTSEYRQLITPQEIVFSQNSALHKFAKLYQDINNYTELVLPEKKQQCDSEEIYRVVKHFQNQVKSTRHLEHVIFTEIKWLAEIKLQLMFKAYKDIEVGRIKTKKQQILQQHETTVNNVQAPVQAGQQILAEKPVEDFQLTEQQIVELSQILQQFSAKAMEQAQVSLFVTELAEDSVLNVGEANAELTKAKEYQGGSTVWFTTLFVALSILLWVWEYLNTITTYSSKQS